MIKLIQSSKYHKLRKSLFDNSNSDRRVNPFKS